MSKDLHVFIQLKRKCPLPLPAVIKGSAESCPPPQERFNAVTHRLCYIRGPNEKEKRNVEATGADEIAAAGVVRNNEEGMEGATAASAVPALLSRSEASW